MILIKSLIGTMIKHPLYGYGTVVYHYIGPCPGGDWMVLYDKPNYTLHDGNGYCENKGAPNRCWYYYEREIAKMSVGDNSIKLLLSKRGM